MESTMSIVPAQAKCIDEIIRLFPTFFSPSSMKFFNSKVYNEVYGGCVFITSEKDSGPYQSRRAWDGKRRYTVRVMLNPSKLSSGPGRIMTWGNFGDYATLRQARRQAKWLAGEILSGNVIQDGYELAIKA